MSIALLPREPWPIARVRGWWCSWKLRERTPLDQTGARTPVPKTRNQNDRRTTIVAPTRAG